MVLNKIYIKNLKKIIIKTNYVLIFPNEKIYI
jgi:hypothetical protein